MEKLLLLFVLVIFIQHHGSTAEAANLDYKPNLLQVAESLNLTSFLKVVNQCGLHKIINHEAYFTVFAPSNEAFAHEKKYPGEDVLCDKVQLHIGRGNIKSNEITNEMTIKSLLSKRTIRLNVYEDNKVVTANGRPVIATDHEARNGVLHVIGEVMSSVYQRQGSIISEIDECCPQHSELVELVKLAGLYGTLDENGPFTLLAPNNGAFSALHPDFINHLKKNRTKLANFLSAHVLSGTLYSAGLEDGMTIKTLAGNKLTVSKPSKKDIKFGKAGVTLADITASNGALHAIDQVIFPTSSNTLLEHERPQNLVQVLQEKGYNSFANALKATKLDKVIDHEGHFTVFAPTNEAFDNPKAYPQDTTLNERVAYYIVRGLIKESMVSDELMVPSLLSKRQLRFNVYQEENDAEIKTINGQPITFRSFEAHNGIVHELNSGIDYVPPRHGKLHDILRNLPQFSAFVKLMDEFHPGIFEHSSAFTMTLLAPTNEVVDAALKSGANGKDLAQTFLLNHIIPESWYTSGLQHSVASLGGKPIRVSQMTFENRWPQVIQYLLNDNVAIEIADFTAVNGVLHQVNGLIF